MPLYAPFGNAIFGETLFGAPPSNTIFTTMSIVPLGYDTLEVNWTPPGGVWTEQVLLRSSYGIPVSTFDGVTLLDQTHSFSTQFVDQGLKSGRFYYYALFCFSTVLDSFVLAGTAQGLVLTDYGFGGTYQSWLPEWYLELDANFGTNAQPLGPLARYLNMIGYETDWIRSEIETFVTFANVDFISGALLPAFGANYGVPYEPKLGMTRSRVLVKNAVFLYKNRGTANGIEAAASAFSGYGCEVTIGPNIEIQLDDCAFDRSVGHWRSTNSTSTITAIPASTYALTPPHTTYNPVPGLGNFLTTKGYLPINNDNVALISAGVAAGSTASWVQLMPAMSPSPREHLSMAYSSGSSAVFLFGGLASGSIPQSDMWSFSGSSWTNVTPAAPTQPSARLLSSTAYDTSTSTIVLFGGESSGGSFFNDTWSWNGTTWTQLFPATSPTPARSGAALVYDTSTGTVILFGGYNNTNGALNDTWSWNGTTWSKLSPATSPPARTQAGIAYDVGSSNLILFGGFDFNGNALSDTWTWNGTTWTQVSIGASPFGPLGGVSMCYDANKGAVIMFGGLYYTSGMPTYTNGSAWWNGTAWVQFAVVTRPSARSNASMVYDTSAGNTVLFGGLGVSLTNDTWTFNASTNVWTQQSPATSPSIRSYQTMAYDTLSSTAVLFGGFTLNDTWSWNGTTWTQVNLSTSPPARYGAMMAYDTNTPAMILFGGTTASTALNDTWSWSGTTWTQLFPAASPTARWGSSMAYDSATTTLVLFGGQPFGTDPSTAVNETWTWNGSTWSHPSPATSPSARSFAAMIFDTSENRMVLFGGINTSGVLLSDTWLWDGTTWTQQFPVTVPPARSNARMVYNSVLGEAVMFGGNGISGKLNDTWLWNGTTWTLAPATASNPSARSDFGMSFDTALSATVLFGGTTNGISSLLSDTWLLTSAAISSALGLSTCTSATATTLGLPIPQQATPPTYVLSAYFQNIPQATPVTRSFFMQIDWYGLNGVLISSTAGTPITEVSGTWTRASVVGTPPAGALTFGRTVKSSGALLVGDLHLMDAEQVEVNTLATPGPTSWQPPRDIKCNLLPVRQNLITNPQGFAGVTGWTVTNGTEQSSHTMATPPLILWPAETSGGFVLTATSTSNIVFSTTCPVNPGVPYTFSCYARPAVTARTVQLTIQWLTATNTLISAPSVMFNETVGVFVRGAVIDAVAPLNAAKATIQITVESPANTEIHYIGAILFEPSGFLQPYFDANFSPASDYIFEGAVNSSVSDYYPSLAASLSRLVAVLPDYIPIGSTFSLFVGAQALTNAGLVG